jgi:hypothetical protein
MRTQAGWEPGSWPPAWNPFEVFILVLCIVNSVGLARGNSGSQSLDARLSVLAIVLWGVTLGVGALLALAGVYCYRRRRTLVAGLYLERSGLVLAGTAAAVYSAVVLLSAADVNGVRYTVCVQSAFAAAAFYRAIQDHRALARTYRLAREGVPDVD